jgi:outer membrane lipoprotein carrier protein
MKRFLLLLTLAACSATGFADTLTPAERADLLSKLQALREKNPAIEATFSEQRTSHLLKKPVTSSGSIDFHVPNKFRREVTNPNPSLTVSNGRELWIYYPNFKEAEHYTLGQRPMFDDALAALTAGLNFSRVEEFYSLNIAHNDGVYELTLTPKHSNLKRVVNQLTVVLDKDLDVRRTELILPKGDKVTTNYTNTRRTDLPAGTFEFNPPSDVHVTRPLGK